MYECASDKRMERDWQLIVCSDNRMCCAVCDVRISFRPKIAWSFKREDADILSLFKSLKLIFDRKDTHHTHQHNILSEQTITRNRQSFSIRLSRHIVYPSHGARRKPFFFLLLYIEPSNRCVELKLISLKILSAYKHN